MSRCEHELKAYQLQYPALVGGHAASGVAGSQNELLSELSGSIEELPPWIGQAKYMSPLLVAYEARIEELTEKNQEQLHDFAQLKAQYDELFKRNNEAEAELESNIKNLLGHMDAQKGGAGAKKGPLDEDEVSELQEQVSLYREQLAIVNSQKLELETEVNKLHASLGEMKAERDQHWAAEVKKIQSQLAALRLERDRYASSSSNLSQTQLDLVALQKDHASLQKKFMSAQVSLEALEKNLEESMDKEKTASASLLHAERDLESLLKTLQNMEGEMESMKAKEVASVKRENEALAKMEAAKLAQAQAQLREQNLSREVARANEKLEFELSQAHKQAAEEVAALYERSKTNESKLNEEIASLSLVVAELEAQKDKAVRESSLAKAQADQVYTAVQGELLALKSSLDSAKAQLSEMHQAAENHLSKLRRQEAELSRAQDFFAKEKAALQESNQGLKMKHEAASLAAQNATAQAQRLADNLARLERDHAELKRTSETAVSKLQSALLDSEAARKAESDDLKRRLEEAYRLHEQSEARASELLATQEVLSGKWREENKHVRSHLSKLLTEEKTASAALHAKLAEAEARVSQLMRERDQAMQFQTQYESLKRSHEQSQAELGHRINVLSSELSAAAAREPEYLLALKTSQGKLDRAEIEVKRTTRQYEAARKKVEFLEMQAMQLPAAQASAPVMPLQNQTGILNQAQGSNPMLSSSVGRAGLASSGTYQPIPFAQSLLPPSFTKAV